MRKAFLMGVLLTCGTAAYATSFGVTGEWATGNGIMSACSNTGVATVGCSATAPGWDTGDFNTGPSYLSASEGFVYSSLEGGIEVKGQMQLGAQGKGGVPSPSQPIVTFTGSVDLPSEWESVSVYGYVKQATDQYSGPRQNMPIYLTGSGGQSITERGNDLGGLPPELAGMFSHTAGTPFNVSWSQQLSCCEAMDSSEYYEFALIFVDPPSDAGSPTPEPATYLLMGAGLLALLPLRKMFTA